MNNCSGSFVDFKNTICLFNRSRSDINSKSIQIKWNQTKLNSTLIYCFILSSNIMFVSLHKHNGHHWIFSTFLSNKLNMSMVDLLWCVKTSFYWVEKNQNSLYISKNYSICRQSTWNVIRSICSIKLCMRWAKPKLCSIKMHIWHVDYENLISHRLNSLPSMVILLLRSTAN